MLATVIAAYAAVVATCALGWEVYRWFREREPELELDLSRTHAFRPDGQIKDLLVVEIRNRSASRRANITSVGYVASWSYKGERHSFTLYCHPYDGASLPGVVEPNDAGVTCRPVPRLNGDEPLEDVRLRAWAWTSTGRKRIETAEMPIALIPEFRDPGRALPTVRWTPQLPLEEERLEPFDP